MYVVRVRKSRDKTQEDRGGFTESFIESGVRVNERHRLGHSHEIYKSKITQHMHNHQKKIVLLRMSHQSELSV